MYLCVSVFVCVYVLACKMTSNPLVLPILTTFVHTFTTSLIKTLNLFPWHFNLGFL